jgi:hypothetical protein
VEEKGILEIQDPSASCNVEGTIERGFVIIIFAEMRGNTWTRSRCSCIPGTLS